MQHVDRIAEIQSLTEPARLRRVRVDVYSQRVVLGSEVSDRIDWHRIGRRYRREQPAVRSAEAELTVGLPRHLIPLLVDRTMMSAAKQGEIRQHRGAALRPVADVMALTEPYPAAGEATAAIAMVKRSS